MIPPAPVKAGAVAALLAYPAAPQQHTEKRVHKSGGMGLLSVKRSVFKGTELEMIFCQFSMIHDTGHMP